MKKQSKAPRTKLTSLDTANRGIPSMNEQQLAHVAGAMYKSYPPWGGPNDYVFDEIF